jgi:hypothetical protein
MDTVFIILPSGGQPLPPRPTPSPDVSTPKPMEQLVSGAYYKIGLKSKPGKFFNF